MSTAKIPSKEFDALREYILESEGQEVEVLVDGRHCGRPISVCLVGERGISGLTASELGRAVNRYFEGQSERVRLRTQFYLRAYHDISGIFLQYRMSDHLLEMARDALEVPEQKARPSLGFILEVGGEYLERILLDHPPAFYGRAYVVEFVLEEENNTVYFRMYNNDQRFFSVEKDKLRGEK